MLSLLALEAKVKAHSVIFCCFQVQVSSSINPFATGKEAAASLNPFASTKEAAASLNPFSTSNKNPEKDLNPFNT